MRKICIYGNPILRKKGESISLDEISSYSCLVEDMFEIMYKTNGIGLAAHQVGEAKRLAVIDTTANDEDGKKLVLFNPEIVSRSDEYVVMEEGCLSFPDILGDISRNKEVTVCFIDQNGKKQEQLFTGLLAVVAQHEIDHLNGVLFIDRMSPVKKILLKKKLANLKTLYGSEK